MNLYQDVFFRSLDLLRGRHTIERLHELRQSQYWPRERLREWQLDRLNALLVQARENSPYYREVMAGIRLPLKSLDEFSDVPILSKDDMRRHGDALSCSNVEPGRFVRSRTGGSTGEPTFYYWDKRGMDWNRGSVYRAAEWGGAPLGEKAVQMTGSHFDFTRAQTLSSKAVFFLQRYRDYSVAVLTEGLFEKYYQGMQSWKPRAIWGYASGVTAFAQYVRRQHPGATFHFLRSIFTSSETLRPDQRATIEEVFGAGAVFDQYGSREMYMASECRQHSGYHLHSDVVYTEIVDKGNRPCAPGQLGRVLVTDMSNHAFPFIRYEIGDVGTMSADDSPCPCGVTLPRLQSVEGRIADMIVLADRVLTAPNVTILMSDMPGIRAYQVRQPSMSRLEVSLVPGEGYGPDVRAYVLSSMRSMAGPAVEILISEVAEIPVPESGKRRYVISDVSKEHL